MRPNVSDRHQGDNVDRIKSAYELAMEKVEGLAAPTKEKRLEWEAVPKGQKLAATHMKGQEGLATGLAEVSDEERQHVLRGAIEVLTANLQLPKNEAVEKTTARAAEGIRQALGDNPETKEVLGRIDYVAEQFKTNGEQQRQQAYQQLVQQFQAQVQQMMRQQGPAMAANQMPNVETMPEFQGEWARLRVQMDEQYEGYLAEYRKAIQALV